MLALLLPGSLLLHGGGFSLVFQFILSLPFYALYIWLFTRFRAVRRLLLLAVSILPAAGLWVMGLFAIVFWWPVSFITELLLRFIPLDALISKLLLIPARFSRDPLLKGDRQTAAEAIWPRAVYPDLYGTVPDDLRRPIYEDGRLLGGHSVTWLADRHLTDAAFRSAIRFGFKAGVLALIVQLTFIILSALLTVFAFFPALMSGDRPIIEQWPGDDPVRVSAWSLLAANAGSAFAHMFGQLGVLVASLPVALLMAVGLAIIIALLLLRVWVREQGSPYELVTKDAEVRWPYRAETRRLLRQTYLRQLAHATGRLKGEPTFHVGTATGTLRVRGDPSAPVPGQPLKLDSESLSQHTLVFGGTGEGKTTALLKPIVRQVLGQRRYGAFVVDAKGVLWRDIKSIADSLGRGADVVVIGTGENQSGINVMANLTPSQVSAALRSVLVQIGGESENSFWQDMAASILRHALTIGLGYAKTAEGAAETAKGLNPYSLWWAYQAVLRAPVMDGAIATIRRDGEQLLRKQQAAAKSAPIEEARRSRDELKAFMTSELSDSIAYLESAWRDMAKETKSGIVANVTQLLDGLGGNTALRELFASGREEGTVPITVALDGKLMLIALSSIEDGLPARLISILLKTSLYREARRREERHRQDEKIDPAPLDRPCLVVMDEVQELVTVDPTSGLSDATFWNVARSAGLAGLFATQTLAALKQAMGENAADNFIQQARSKVFFRTEEQSTVSYACWCAGEFERNRVFDEGQRESLDHRLLIDGWSPLAPVDESETLTAGPRAFFAAAKGLLLPDTVGIGRASEAATYAPDLRYIATDGSPAVGSSGNAASMGSLQAANWRAEDLARTYRSQGNALAPALTASDIIHMGRWHAFAHIQRAGAVRQDIIAVEHDFSR